jgi:hypothetical protein
MPSESPSRSSISLFRLAKQGIVVLRPPSEEPKNSAGAFNRRAIKNINTSFIVDCFELCSRWITVRYCESSLNHPLFCATPLLFPAGVGSMVFRVAVAAIIELEQQMKEVVALRRALRRFNTERHRRIEFKRRRRAPQRLGNRVTPGRIVR